MSTVSWFENFGLGMPVQRDGIKYIGTVRGGTQDEAIRKSDRK